MSSLKEINGRLAAQPFVSGFSASSEDARIFEEMLGGNTNVIQWVARMASYYQAERDELLHGKAAAAPAAAPAAAAPAKKAAEPAPKAAAPAAAAEEDDDIDLFGETTEEDIAALEAKKKADADKKKAKKDVIAKSSILFDVKAWDDTIDLEALAQKLHAIQKDGLLWGDYKLVPVAFGVKKLQQLIVIEDDKVSGDDLEEMIMSFEDEVQSMDIVAWNKI